MPYLKINHDDAKPAFEELELPEEPYAWLKACHDALGCMTIQTAPTVLRGIVLVIDEEGKLFDGWQKRINKFASILYASDIDVIVGDAILARVEGYELAPLTAHDIDRIQHFFS